MAAESVGLAASVAGLVSLGLQVTGGIFKYVDAFENRQEDLEFVRQQNEVLRATLEAINESVVDQNPSPELTATIHDSMKLFKKELDKIENLYPKLVDSGGSGWTSRLDNRRKRFTYPFKRPKVQELGQQLQKAGTTLQLTLNAIDLRISTQHTASLAAMELSVRGVSSETQRIRSGLSAIEAPIVEIRDQVSTTHGAIETCTQLLLSKYGTISNQTQETSNLVQGLAELLSKQQQEAYKQHQETIKTIERLVGQTKRDYGPDHVPAAVVRRLADKPALLNEVGNAVQTFEQAQDQAMALTMAPRPSRNRTQITGRKKRRIAVGFNYTGLTHVLKTAINMSFALTYGAGGFSISPSFACNPTVDDKLDPAFRIVALIGYGLKYLDEGTEHVLITGMKRLIRLFDDGKVCPTAVNKWNQTLMHWAISSIDPNPDRRGSSSTGPFVELVQTLMSYGVAPFTYDTRAILEILLSAGDHSLLDYRDAYGLTALESAMILSSKFCVNGTDIQRCYDYECNCLRRDASEIKSINEKQATLLETLEDLVLEFEDKAVDYLGVDSPSTQGSFQEFWSACWEVRMNEERTKLRDKELKEAEENGAQANDMRNWGPQREVKDENPYNKRTDLKYWLDELDKICPEYSEPWPEELCRVSEVP
ncbi:hypothetical protein DHEL01_v205908 [Diaporthe helianthi]|uniref:Fungal N-terminal domain-containing protein n=1 Tax=Diaporthe helianthi TaxID=158607 RepID=A0A2P5HZM8_DIAHE|nr:hypothetical protein DHEL01_v205908 [Diaporthe helianthi]